MKITNPPAGHDQLSDVSTSDHHVRFSDANARAAVVEDAAYGAGWDADTTHAPSQNAVYDILESVKVSDTAYASSWNGVTTIPPSKNAVYDKIEALHAAPSDTAYASSWNGVTAIAPSKNAVYDKIETMGHPMELIGTVDADDDATMTITGLDTSVYETYIMYLTGMHPATNQAEPQIRFGDSGGIDSGGSDYAWQVGGFGTTNGHNFSYSENTSYMRPHAYVNYAGPSGGSGGGLGGEFTIYADPDGQCNTLITGHICEPDNSSPTYGTMNIVMTGQRHAVLTLTQVQFKFSSGNVTSGRMTIYGARHA